MAAKADKKVLKRCFIRCINNRHPPIEIKTDKVFVGRGPETKIIDPNVSRQQSKKSIKLKYQNIQISLYTFTLFLVCLKANFKEGYVLIRRMGQNPTILNVKELQLNLGYEAHHGDRIELIPDKHPYILDFEYEEELSKKTSPEMEKVDESNSSKKKNPENGESSSRKRARTPSDEKSEKRSRHSSKDTRDTKSKEDKKSKKTEKNEQVIVLSSRTPSDEKRSRHSSKDTRETKPKEDKKSKESKKTEENEQVIELLSSNSSSGFNGFSAENNDNKWEEMDNKSLYIFTAKGVKSSSRIAGYDMDGTIIKTKSGNVFPKSREDWQLAMPEVPGKLKGLFKNNFKIVFFTNQMGIAKGKTTIEDVKWKIEAIAAKINVPIQAFVATGKGIYRKPAPGMWNTLVELKNDGIKIDKSWSLYVGDAAGRPEVKAEKRKKDHSCGDRLFALNIGVDFYTPEMHFKEKKEGSWTKPEFEPKSVLDVKDILTPKSANLTYVSCEVIIMIGCPGSGKSHFVKKYLEPKGYVVINRDTLKTLKNCLSQLEKALKAGKKAVIDNTNPDISDRKNFLDIAKKFKVPCRCFMMNVSVKQSKHNNVFREITDKSHAAISDMVFNIFK